MDVSKTDRIKSGRLAMRYLTDPSVREDLRRASVPLGAPVVVCEWETSMGEVMSMINRARTTLEVKPDHVIIMVRKDETMHSIVGTSQNIELICDYISSNEVHSDSCIGHVHEALRPRKQWGIDAGTLAKPAPVESSAVSLNGMNFELV